MLILVSWPLMLPKGRQAFVVELIFPQRQEPVRAQEVLGALPELTAVLVPDFLLPLLAPFFGPVEQPEKIHRNLHPAIRSLLRESQAEILAEFPWLPPADACVAKCPEEEAKRDNWNIQ